MAILAGINVNISYYPSKYPQVRLDDLCVRALRAPHGVEVHRRQQEAQAQKVLGDLQVGILQAGAGWGRDRGERALRLCV